MKLVTFRAPGEAPAPPSTRTPSRALPHPSRAGIVVGDKVLDLETCFIAFEQAHGRKADEATVKARYGEGVLGFVEHEVDARPAADAMVASHAEQKLPPGVRVHALADLTLLAPIPRPPSMRDGYAFRQHVETARKNRGLEMIPEFDQFPVFYFTNHQAVIGPGELRVQKQHMDRLDFELEAAIVIGKEGKNVPAARADELIFGMTIMNDFSARALQMEEMKLSLGPAKGKDFATGLGPYLVTLDELAPHMRKTPQGAIFDLKMRAKVNGVEVSRGNVKDMNWTFAQIIERASYGVMLYPGDVIGSGTCGTGCFLELNGSKITQNQWLGAGDTIALEIQAIGRLENTVVIEDETPYVA